MYINGQCLQKGNSHRGFCLSEQGLCESCVQVAIQEGLAGSLLQSAFRWPILPTGGWSEPRLDFDDVCNGC